MYPQVKIVFDRKHQAAKNKPGVVEIYIYHEGKTQWLSTGVKVLPSQWKDRVGVVNCLDQDSLNERISVLLNRINSYITSLMAAGKPFSWDEFNAVRDRKAKGEDNFLSFVERYMRERADIRESTRAGHHRLVTAMKDFGEFKNFSDINKKMIIRFDDWLHTRKVNGKLIQQSAIWSYHKILRSYINEAVRRDLMESNPYKSLRIDKGEKEDVDYLTEEEIFKIKSAELTIPALEKVRDMCLIQYYTGVAFADLKELRPENVIEHQGRKAVMSYRQKTGTSFYTVLLPQAIEILERNNWKMDMMTNQQYNMRLKLLAEDCKLNRHITSHLFRKSAGMFYLNAGMPIEVVARILGHAKISTTQKAYAKILNQTVNAAFDKLLQS